MRNIPKCREIIRLISIGYNNKDISEMTGSTRKTIKKIRETAEVKHMGWKACAEMDDAGIYYRLFPPKNSDAIKQQPDVDSAFLGFLNGKTKMDMYMIYAADCKEKGKEHVCYERFRKQLCDKETEYRATDDKSICPGEAVVTFWLKEPIAYSDYNGEAYSGKIFVGILPYSQYAYVQVYQKDTKENWIDAHVKMFRFFGGVPKKILAEKSKSAQYGGEIQPYYRELAEHYGSFIELNEKKQFSEEILGVEEWFACRISDKISSSFEEARESVKALLKEFLMEKITVKGYNRISIYKDGEKKSLMKLPKEDYAPVIKKDAQVMLNCHIKYEANYYSVPYIYAMKQDKTVQVAIFGNMIKVYYHDALIAEHPRVKNRKGTYMTRIEHMPSDEEARQMEWNAERLIRWAGEIGPNTKKVIQCILNSKDIVQKAFIHCRTILVFENTYGREALEDACGKLDPSSKGAAFKLIEDILKNEKS